jgi:hypothetical protein
MTRVRRYRHLAAKAKALVEHNPIDAVAPRLKELSDKPNGDADRDEQEARALLADEPEALTGAL